MKLRVLRKAKIFEHFLHGVKVYERKDVCCFARKVIRVQFFRMLYLICRKGPTVAHVSTYTKEGILANQKTMDRNFEGVSSPMYKQRCISTYVLLCDSQYTCQLPECLST